MFSDTSKENIPLPTLSIILLVAFVVIFFGILFYRSQKEKIVNEKQNELASIASLKINEIVRWRSEHIRDGIILQSIIPRNQLISDYLKKKDSGDLEMEIFERMQIFINNYDYHSILLIDTAGSIRFIYPYSEQILPENATNLNNLHDTELILSDIHFSDDLPCMIHIDLQVPLFTFINNFRFRFGTLLLRIDPQKDLFPLIQSWPATSKSAETLLVRAEGDSILYLNELKYHKNNLIQLKLPKNMDLPAAKASTGYEGIFEGVDYRGVPVISFLKSIPDSPWFMVTKVDKEEIYSPLDEVILFTSVIALLFILLFSVLLVYVWRSQHIRYLRILNLTRDKFFSIVSHDLKSPFTSIIGFADILIKEVESNAEINVDNVKKYAEIISQSSQNAVDLLRNLIEWSRLNTNRLVFNPGEVDLVTLINKEISLMNSVAIQKSITINLTAPSNLKIFADKDMLGLVLRNLISNSIKFSNPGGTINISAVQTEKMTRVDVCDNGIGMRKEIFDNLLKNDLITTTPGTFNEHGTGLGLILIKEFVTLHGGHIHIESEAGKCTRISISLPLQI